MNLLNRNLNAVIAIAAREVMNFTRTPTQIIIAFVFPIIFLGIMGGNLEQNLGGDVSFNFLYFIFFGLVVSTLYQTSFNSLTSLIEDRENDFTQEIFVAPISRYAVILGKIFGGMFKSLVALFGLITIALIMQVPLTLPDVGYVLLMWPIICIAGGTLGVLFISIVNDSHAADAGSFMIIFPQIFLAGIIIPLTHSSGILGVLAHMMPMTYLADLMRNLIYLGSPEYSQIVLYSPLFDLSMTIVLSTVFIIMGTLLFTHNEQNR